MSKTRRQIILRCSSGQREGVSQWHIDRRVLCLRQQHKHTSKMTAIGGLHPGQADHRICPHFGVTNRRWWCPGRLSRSQPAGRGRDLHRAAYLFQCHTHLPATRSGAGGLAPALTFLHDTSIGAPSLPGETGVVWSTRTIADQLAAALLSIFPPRAAANVPMAALRVDFLPCLHVSPFNQA